MKLAKPSRGFTLIELLVVIAIAGILAAVALPAYSDYVKRGKIPEATNNLSSMSVKLEQYFQDQHTYVGGCAAAGTGTVADLPSNDDFTYSCSNLTTSTYTVTATGSGTMSGFTYTINQSNTKATSSVPSGWTLPASNCWVTKKGGVC
jgi:type IV pilus assembly protein PilE